MLLFNGRRIVNTKGLMMLYIDAPEGDIGIYGNDKYHESIKLQSVASFEEGERALQYIVEHYSDDSYIDYSEG